MKDVPFIIMLKSLQFRNDIIRRSMMYEIHVDQNLQSSRNVLRAYEIQMHS